MQLLLRWYLKPSRRKGLKPWKQKDQKAPKRGNKKSKSTQTDPAKTKEIFWLFGSKPKERNVD